VGGLFVESSFLLKQGTAVEVELELPDIEQVVRAAGRVVNRVEDDRAGDTGKPRGFAIELTELRGSSEIALRAYLAAGDMFAFVESFIARLPKLSRRDVPHLVEMIVRWELHRESLPE
jgi:hypothetical protein